MKDDKIIEPELEFYTLLNPHFGHNVGDKKEETTEKLTDQLRKV